MNSIKYISCRTWNHNIVSRLQSTVPGRNASASGIEIPLRIERSPTDILRALSEAIPPNPNSYHYKFWDDRYFRPSNSMNKVNWALAREWGKRAAHFVHHEHYDLFPQPMDNTQIPILENPYFPQSKDEVSEELLLKSISNGDVELALRIHELLDEDISTKGKLALLELLCYYNGKHPSTDEKYPEYRFYAVQKHKKIYKEWINAQNIQKLFDFLIKQDPITTAAAYNALICGMSKYGNVSDALKYYEKCIKEDIPLHINTYNELFKKTEYLHSIVQERPKIFNNLLSTMFKSHLQPNAVTMNSCLRGIVLLYPVPKCKEIVESLLRVFKKLGVQRSLGSYYFEICSIMESGETSDGQVFDEIFNEIAKQKFEIQDVTDLDFFTGTMQILAYELENADYALRLDRIFHSNNNEKFIGCSAAETQYHEAFLSIVLQNKSLKEFGVVYKSLVPHRHVPTMNLTMSLLQKLKAGDLSIVAEYLPSLLRSTIQLNVWLSIDLFSALTELMLDCCRLEEYSSMREMCAKNTADFYEQIVKRQDDYPVVEPAVGQCILNAILLQLYGKKPDEALDMLNTLPKLNIRDNKYLQKEKIYHLLDICVEQRLYNLATVFLECLISCQHPEVNAYATKLDKHLPIDTPEKKVLLNLVGRRILRK